jgi:tetratricopeptide (TPR) repeat protein
MSWTPRERYRLADWGYSLYREGCHEQAIVVFEALLEDAPSDAWAGCALAANQLALGQVLEALRTLEPFRAEPAARLLRAETMAIAGNLREASAEAGILRSLVQGPGWARLQLRLRAAAQQLAAS